MNEDDKIQLGFDVDNTGLTDGLNKAGAEIDKALDGISSKGKQAFDDIVSANKKANGEVKTQTLRTVESIMQTMKVSEKEAEALLEKYLSKDIDTLSKEISNVQKTADNRYEITKANKEKIYLSEKEYQQKQEQLSKLMNDKAAVSSRIAAKQQVNITTSTEQEKTRVVKEEAEKRKQIILEEARNAEKQTKAKPNSTQKSGAQQIASERKKAVQEEKAQRASGSAIKGSINKTNEGVPSLSQLEGYNLWKSIKGGAVDQFYKNQFSHVTSGYPGNFKDPQGWGSKDPKQGSTEGFEPKIHRSVDNSDTTRLDRRMAHLKERYKVHAADLKSAVDLQEKYFHNTYTKNLDAYVKYKEEYLKQDAELKKAGPVGVKNFNQEPMMSFEKFVAKNGLSTNMPNSRLDRMPSGIRNSNDKYYGNAAAQQGIAAGSANSAEFEYEQQRIREAEQNEQALLKAHRDRVEAISKSTRQLTGKITSTQKSILETAAGVSSDSSRVTNANVKLPSTGEYNISGKIEEACSTMQRLINALTENRIGGYYDNQNKSPKPKSSSSSSAEEVENELTKAAKREADERLKVATQMVNEARRTATSYEELRSRLQQAEGVVSGVTPIPNRSAMAYRTAVSTANRQIENGDRLTSMPRPVREPEAATSAGVRSGELSAIGNEAGRVTGMFSNLRQNIIAFRTAYNQLSTAPIVRADGAARNYNGTLGRIRQTLDALGVSSQRYFENSAIRAQQTSDKVYKYFKSASRIASGIMISQAFYRVINGIRTATSDMAKFETQMEQTQVTFTQLLGGNGSAAKAMLQQLEDLAAKTPYEIDSSIDNAKQLLAYGFKSAEVVPALTTMQDAASVNGNDPEKLQRIVNAIGKVKASGYLSARERNSLYTSGIKINEILKNNLEIGGNGEIVTADTASGAGSKSTVVKGKDGVHTVSTGSSKKKGKQKTPVGVKTPDEVGKTPALTDEQVMSLISSKSIKSDVAIKAILQGMDKDYGELASKLNRTTAGLLSNIHDSLMMVGQTLFEGLNKTVGKYFATIANKLQDIRDAARKHGPGGVLEVLVPPAYQNIIRTIVSELALVGHHIKQIFVTAGSLKYFVGGFVVGIRYALVPIIAALKLLGDMLEWLNKKTPAVKILFGALGSIAAVNALIFTSGAVVRLALNIARLTGLGPLVKFFGDLVRLTMMKIATGSVEAAEGVSSLAAVIAGALSAEVLIAAAIVAAIVGAFIAIGHWAKQLKAIIIDTFGSNAITNALCKFIDFIKMIYDWMGKLVHTLGSWASKKLGINPDKFLKPKAEDKAANAAADALKKEQEALEKETGAMQDNTDATNAATEANKRYAASFDEIHNIEDEGGGVGGGGTGLDPNDNMPDPGNEKKPDDDEKRKKKKKHWWDDFHWPKIPPFVWPDFPDFHWPKIPAFDWPKIPEFVWPDILPFKWPVIPPLKWPEIPPLKWPDLQPFKWPDLQPFKWPDLQPFKWPDLQPFKWPELQPFTWPDLQPFKWPELQPFTWPDLPPFHWPELQPFTWPVIPPFHWPEILPLHIPDPVPELNGSFEKVRSVCGNMGKAVSDGFSTVSTTIGSFNSMIAGQCGQLADNIGNAFAGIGSSIVSGLGEGFKNALGATNDFFSNLWDTVSGWVEKHKILALTIGAVIVAIIATICTGGLDVVLAGLGGIGASIGEFFAGLDIAGALAGIGATIAEFFSGLGVGTELGIVASDVSGFFVALSGIIMTGLAIAGKAIVQHWDEIMAGLGGFFGNLGANIQGAFDEISGKVIKFKDDAAAAIKTGWDTVTSDTATCWGNISSSLGATWDSVSGKAAQIFSTIGDKIGSTWGTVSSNTSSTWSTVSGGLASTWDSVSGKARETFSNIGEKIATTWGTVSSNTSSTWSTISSGLESTWKNIHGNISSVVGNIASTLGNAWNTIGSGISSAWNGIAGTFSSVFGRISGLVNDLRNTFNGAFPAMGSIAAHAFDGVASGIRGVMGPVISGMNTMIDSLNRFKIDVPRWVPEIGGKSFGFSIGHIHGFKNGGIIDKNQIIEVAEGNKREAVLPLQNPSAMAPFADAVAARMMQAQGNSNSSSSQPTQHLYIGTYIGDERSLLELERKLQVVRAKEDSRRA